MKSFLILIPLFILLSACSGAKETKTYFCITPNGGMEYSGAQISDKVSLGLRTITITDPGTGSTLEIPFAQCVLLIKR